MTNAGHPRNRRTCEPFGGSSRDSYPGSLRGICPHCSGVFVVLYGILPVHIVPGSNPNQDNYCPGSSTSPVTTIGHKDLESAYPDPKVRQSFIDLVADAAEADGIFYAEDLEDHAREAAKKRFQGQ